MADERTTPGPLDERGVARKYGIRELTYPDVDQIRALSLFLDGAIESGRCPAVPKTAVLVTLEFFQGTTTRQHITKNPRMTTAEYDALQTPYYLAARIVAKLQRSRQEAKGAVYQTTWISLARFMQLLRELLDPACPWLRSRTIPEDILASMTALREFLAAWPEQKRKGRATQ